MNTTVESLDADVKKMNETDADMALIFPNPLDAPIKKKAGRPRKVVEVTPDPSTNEIPLEDNYFDKKLWKEAMLIAMKNYAVKHPNELVKCVPIADEFVRLYNERWE